MSGMGTHQKKAIPRADVQPVASKLNLREDFDLENSIFNVLDTKLPNKNIKFTDGKRCKKITCLQYIHRPTRIVIQTNFW